MLEDLVMCEENSEESKPNKFANGKKFLTESGRESALHTCTASLEWGLEVELMLGLE
jgi:hypothetical protein